MVWKGLAEGWENGLVGCGVCREEESELAAKGFEEGAEDGGKEGTVKKVMHKKVEVVIESIGFILSAYIDKSKIVLLEK